MTESADILISHFRDALKQAQGYVNYGLLAGLLSLLTTAGVTGSGEGGEVRFNVPLVGPLDELSAMV
ncbi:MAG: hypothetical protein QNI86_12660, partial [Halieaceae bacterium]|nr:hypothetical protein [Halieaceae bacterium]